MKSSRNYPVYTVNKHAEGLLVGGHPWVYENDILGFPEAEPENGTHRLDMALCKSLWLPVLGKALLFFLLGCWLGFCRFI